jgi:carboxyl-terminal processing protease
MKKRTYFLLAVLLLSSLACNMVTQAWRLHPTATPIPTRRLTSTSTITPLSASPTATATVTITPTTTPSPLPPTPTATFTPSPSPTIRPTPSAVQLRVFESLWQLVNNVYLYRDFNGLDWSAIHEEYHQKIIAGLTNADFYDAMAEMIHRLGDNHSSFHNPDEVKAVNAQFSGKTDYAGIGVINIQVPERKRVSIIAVYPGSPAEAAGLKAHDSILEADGKPILDENGFHRDLLVGEAGSTVTLTVQTPGQQPRQVTLTRQRITGPTPVPYQVITTPQGKRVGYIQLLTLIDSTIGSQVGEALKAMTADGPLDGVVLDNRMNPGGASTVFKQTLSYFVNGSVGHFVNRQGSDTVYVSGKNVNGSQKVPLVVLVGKNTYSFGEIFSGVLKDLGRAYVIGETSPGVVEILYVYRLEDGSEVWLAHDTFRPVNHPSEIWEKTGIVPDLTVLSNWDEVTMDTDPVIQAALNHFDGK